MVEESDAWSEWLMLMRYAGCLHVEAEVDQFGDLSLVRSMDIEKHIVPGFRTSAHYLYPLSYEAPHSYRDVDLLSRPSTARNQRRTAWGLALQCVNTTLIVTHCVSHNAVAYWLIRSIKLIRWGHVARYDHPRPNSKNRWLWLLSSLLEPCCYHPPHDR